MYWRWSVLHKAHWLHISGCMGWIRAASGVFNTRLHVYTLNCIDGWILDYWCLDGLHWSELLRYSPFLGLKYELEGVSLV